MAQDAANTIDKKGKIPLFVGGTGFYIDSFFNGLSSVPPVEQAVRDKVEEELNSLGAQEMHRRLLKIDPLFGRKVHLNDHQRIIRGLSVFQATGKALSSYYGRELDRKKEDTLFVALYGEKELLHERINSRVDSMMEKGFLEEVKSLRNTGYGPELKAMQSIGYLELNAFIDGEYTFDNAIEKIKNDTRKYAKRQMTWFKRNKKMEWFHLNERDRVIKRIHSWVAQNK